MSPQMDNNLASKRSDYTAMSYNSGVVIQSNNVYMSFNEHKWATTLIKVYRHLRIMERTKYLAPHFSRYVGSLVSYMASKYNLGGV
jgi:fructose-1,6-bisphosphatase